MSIPADLRQFGIRHLFLAVASIAFGFALNSILPTYGFAMPLAICAFWVGIVIFTPRTILTLGRLIGEILSRNYLTIWEFWSF